MAEYYSTVHMHRVFFIHSSVDGHFSFFVSCLAHLSLKEVVHDPCARCPKGRENSAVTRPSLDSRRCEVDTEDLQRRRSVSREVGVENRKGTCCREDRERAILGTGGSWPLARERLWELGDRWLEWHCVRSWLLCALVGASHTTDSQQMYSELRKADSFPQDSSLWGLLSSRTRHTYSSLLSPSGSILNGVDNCHNLFRLWRTFSVPLPETSPTITCVWRKVCRLVQVIFNAWLHGLCFPVRLFIVNTWVVPA